MPLAGEEGLVAACLQHGTQGPLRRRQAPALALEGHSGHAATIRDAAGLHRCSSRRATWLGIERKERHALIRHAFYRGRGHTASRASAVGARISVAEVIGNDQDDIRLLL